MSRRILVAEDEPRIAAFVEKGLRAAGFAPQVADDGETAYTLATGGGFDLLILDLGLPRLDGLSVLRRLRERGHGLPVLILTARDAVGDRVAGLEGGADDYMPKPFAFEELLARVRLRLRDHARTDTVVTEVRAGGLVLDLQRRQVVADGHLVDLTAREFTLAELMMRHPGQVLSRQQILSHVWGLDFDPGSNVVDVYMRYLRRKVGEQRIETVRGMGYRLRT
jgi:DNA-binding response OmpR family regulator